MFYRFVTVPGFEREYNREVAEKSVNTRMAILGLPANREKIESIMADKNLKEGEIEFWFTEKGFNEIGNHIGATGIYFQWYRLPNIDKSLIIFSDRYQVVTRRLVVGSKQAFNPPKSRYKEILKGLYDSKTWDQMDHAMQYGIREALDDYIKPEHRSCNINT